MTKYGRPKIDPSKCMNEPSRTYLTHDMRKALLRIAHKDGVTEAQALRDAVTDYVEARA